MASARIKVIDLSALVAVSSVAIMIVGIVILTTPQREAWAIVTGGIAIISLVVFHIASRR